MISGIEMCCGMRHPDSVVLPPYRVQVHPAGTALTSPSPRCRCIWFGTDDDGHTGVYLGKDVVAEAGRALTKAIVGVAPHILTWGQYWELVVNWVQYAVLKVPGAIQKSPSFAACVQHFLIHAGGCVCVWAVGVGGGVRSRQSGVCCCSAVLWCTCPVRCRLRNTPPEHVVSHCRTHQRACCMGACWWHSLILPFPPGPARFIRDTCV
jgi:hypothetical protein